MADYREISQEYAHKGIGAALLINGGAAVALLSQAAELKKDGMAAVVASAMLLWAFGTLAAASTWLLAFLSARYVDKSERESLAEVSNLKISNRLMTAGMGTIIISLGLFAAGCISLSLGFDP